jgi:ribonuclease BN (tRNA processing enzyme)
MQLILLGTAGGPRLHDKRSSPSQVVLVGETPYVVDCGYGTARQLLRSGIEPRSLAHVFVTHQHSDHNLDYGNLLYLAWVSGLQAPVETYGPPPIEAMTRAFLDLNAYDLDVRVVDEGRPKLADLVRPHALTNAGVVLENEQVRVTAALVNHPPVEPAFGYRFDTADRSIVFSGDTTPCDALVGLAEGADVLVHEVMHVPAIERIVRANANAERIRAHLLRSHTTLEQVGQVAERAGVKTLVLSHLAPADDAVVSDEVWRDGAAQHFSGEVIVGRDLLVV